MYVCIYVYVYMCMYIYACIYMYVYMCMYMYVYICTSHVLVGDCGFHVGAKFCGRSGRGFNTLFAEGIPDVGCVQHSNNFAI